MAKLIWQNFKYKQHRHYRDYSLDPANQYDLNKVIDTWQNSLWPIKGKYYGKKLKELPFDYLQWVGMNFDINSKGFKLALQELECRQSAHKDSGPDIIPLCKKRLEKTHTQHSETLPLVSDQA